MRRKLVWLLLSCLVVVTLLVTSCAPGATKKEETAPAAEEAMAEEEEPVTLGPFRAGETAQTDKLAVTITAIWLADSYEYYSRSLDKMITRPSGSGTAYLFANIKIKNLDTVRSYDLPIARGIHSLTVGIIYIIRGSYSGGTFFDITGYYGEGGLPLTGGKLPPGEEIEGKVLFIVPSGQTGHWVEYRLQVDPAIWARWLME